MGPDPSQVESPDDSEIAAKQEARAGCIYIQLFPSFPRKRESSFFQEPLRTKKLDPRFRGGDNKVKIPSETRGLG